MFMVIVATEEDIKVVNLDSQQVEKTINQVQYKNDKEIKNPGCSSLCLDESGKILYTGWTDGYIRT